jgi:hypothetical protein
MRIFITRDGKITKERGQSGIVGVTETPMPKIHRGEHGGGRSSSETTVDVV